MKNVNKYLPHLLFGLLAIIIVLLMVATVVEKIEDSDVAMQYIYHAPYMIALWAILGILSLYYLIARGVHKRITVFLLHFSFILIMAGALTTHITGKQGRVHLRQGEQPVAQFLTPDSIAYKFPFEVSLHDFTLLYYPGTFAPMDYVSDIVIEEADGSRHQGRVSMNNIYRYRNYRFYQSGYDADTKGTILSVAHDPYGITITYAGYALLLLAMILYFVQPKSAFRSLLSHPSLRRMTALLLLFAGGGVGQLYAHGKPQTLSPQVAEKWAHLHIYYNDRICPIHTFARDFTVKLYGKPSYRGYTPEQVVAGWFFYYDDWKDEHMIKIKGKEVQQLLGIDGAYASLNDFVSVNGYKLDNALQRSDLRNGRANIEAANEKFNLVSMLVTGAILNIYPHRSSCDSSLSWYSVADRLPTDMPHDEWLFVRNSLSYVAEQVAMGNDVATMQFLDKIRNYQLKVGGDVMPSSLRFSLEKLYNNTAFARPLAMLFLSVGFIFFFICCRAMAMHRALPRGLTLSLNIMMIATLVYLTLHMTMRGYISGHIPLSNGYETMFFMAWCTLLLALLLQRKFSLALPMGCIVAGLSLLVAMMGEASPRITNLMPVLQSPLLSIHVVVIMLSYSLLAFVMLNGVTAVVLRCTSKHTQCEIEYLQCISRIMLYPAVFLLAIGIFVGAVWANISWGRYWGWDPKEVWALITMLIYSILLHTASLPALRSPMLFHLLAIVAFLSVIVTYFGVNFLLGGMHSYA